MKKILASLLGLVLIITPVFAANSATDLGDLQIQVNGVGPVHVYKVSIDTVDTDLTIETPGTNEMSCIVGIQLSETNAANLKFKSSTSTDVWVPELTANQGMMTKIGGGVDFCTFQNQALVVQSSAAISNMVLYTVTSKFLKLP